MWRSALRAKLSTLEIRYAYPIEQCASRHSWRNSFLKTSSDESYSLPCAVDALDITWFLRWAMLLTELTFDELTICKFRSQWRKNIEKITVCVLMLPEVHFRPPAVLFFSFFFLTGHRQIEITIVFSLILGFFPSIIFRIGWYFLNTFIIRFLLLQQYVFPFYWLIYLLDLLIVTFIFFLKEKIVVLAPWLSFFLTIETLVQNVDMYIHLQNFS